MERADGSLFSELVGSVIAPDPNPRTYDQWPLVQGLTGANVMYSTNAAPANYTSASAVLNR